MGGDEADIVERRNSLRKQIKANLVAAAANGKDLEETGSEDDGLLDPSEDDFFLHGSSSDDVDADDEWSAREQASSASGKAASGVSSDERNQRQISARALMPPPGPSCKTFSNSLENLQDLQIRSPIIELKYQHPATHQVASVDLSGREALWIQPLETVVI